MGKLMRHQFESWGIDDFLERYSGLAIVPSSSSGLVLQGELVFDVIADDGRLSDAYEVKIVVPSDFPKEPPVVQETADRIKKEFHRNPDGSLCLGSPLRILTLLEGAPTLVGFTESCVVPFLYAHSFLERHGVLPFGELAHGSTGALKDYRDLFNVETTEASLEMLFLLTLPKRVANKKPCPCGSGRRVGSCHHGLLNGLRRLQSRSWFQKEFEDRCGTKGASKEEPARNDLTMPSSDFSGTSFVDKFIE